MSTTMTTPTPASEMSNTGADVVRQPSVATGAIPPAYAGGVRHTSILSNKYERPLIADDGRLSSGYAADSDTETEAEDAHKNRGGAFVGSGTAKSSSPLSRNVHNGDSAHNNRLSTEYGANDPSNTLYTAKAPPRMVDDGEKPSKHSEPGVIATDFRDSKFSDTKFGQGRDVTPRASITSRSQSPTQSVGWSPTSVASGEKERHLSGAFAGGAAVTDPAAAAEPDALQHQRVATAESTLSEGVKAKITKAELKDAKRLLKVIKAEGKAQKQNLDAAIKELAKLQKVQKQASADESRALSAQGAAARTEHKLHTRFLAAKAKHEHAAAELAAKEEQLQMSRAHAQAQTESLRGKTREIEELRLQKSIDDREREAKMREIAELSRKK